MLTLLSAARVFHDATAVGCPHGGMPTWPQQRVLLLLHRAFTFFTERVRYVGLENEFRACFIISSLWGYSDERQQTHQHAGVGFPCWCWCLGDSSRATSEDKQPEEHRQIQEHHKHYHGHYIQQCQRHTSNDATTTNIVVAIATTPTRTARTTPTRGFDLAQTTVSRTPEVFFRYIIGFSTCLPQVHTTAVQSESTRSSLFLYSTQKQKVGALPVISYLDPYSRENEWYSCGNIRIHMCCNTVVCSSWNTL